MLKYVEGPAGHPAVVAKLVIDEQCGKDGVQNGYRQERPRGWVSADKQLFEAITEAIVGAPVNMQQWMVTQRETVAAINRMKRDGNTSGSRLEKILARMGHGNKSQ